jgi:ATP-dependent helicase/nuclease subunit A
LALAAQANSRLAAIEARFRELEQRASRQSPFDFLSALLLEDCPGRTGISGRAAMLKRLGSDAADAIDAFLGDALEFGRRQTPSLALFIAAQAGQQREIKRDLDSGQGRVRVMTAHGAKGLEARIVFVADAMSTKHSSTNPKVHASMGPKGGMLLWAGSTPDAAGPIREAASEAKARAFEEYRRLLYVGLTRARERLYVVGHRIHRPGKDALPGDLPRKSVSEWPWHALVTQAMRQSDRVIEVPSGEEGRLPILRWPPSREVDLPSKNDDRDVLPESPVLLFHPLAAESMPSHLRPSKAVEFRAADRLTTNPMRAAGRRRGVILHRLFQFLPKYAPAEYGHRARALIRDAVPTLSDQEIEAWIAPVLRALEAPELSTFLDKDARSEVGISGPVRLVNGVIRHVSGRIDRLCVRKKGIDILDFKTGTRPPSGASAEILAQMALYRALARDAFHQPNIACHLYWTGSQRLETLSGDLLDATYATITSA